MRLAFDLNNGGIASYQWGDLHANFRSVATPTPAVLKDTLVSLTSGVANWTTPAEFRSTVSLLHEFAHYLQDITTGVGHADYLQRRTQVRAILSAARDASWGVRPTPDIPTLTSAFFGKLLFRPFSSFSDAELEPIKNRFEILSPQSRITREVLADYSLEALLESEAAATTFAQLTPLKMTDDGFDILKDNLAVLDLVTMGTVYSAPYGYVDELMELPERVRGVAAAGVIAWTLSVLVDIACAYPARTLMRRSNIDAVEFDPGVKFARLMQAYHQADEKAGADIIEALHHQDGALLERALLRMCPVRYPSCEMVYQDWIQVLKALDQEEDATVSLRIQACERRLANPRVASEKTIGALLSFGPGLPFFCRSPYGGGLGYVILGYAKGLDPALVTRLTADMSRNARDLRLVELIAGGEPYVCPFTEQGVCQAVQPACSAGIADINNLPDTNECLVRSGLTTAGWKFN